MPDASTLQDERRSGRLCLCHWIEPDAAHKVKFADQTEDVTTTTTKAKKKQKSHDETRRTVVRNSGPVDLRPSRAIGFDNRPARSIAWIYRYDTPSWPSRAVTLLLLLPTAVLPEARTHVGGETARCDSTVLYRGSAAQCMPFIQAMVVERLSLSSYSPFLGCSCCPGSFVCWTCQTTRRKWLSRLILESYLGAATAAYPAARPELFCLCWIFRRQRRSELSSSVVGGF